MPKMASRDRVRRSELPDTLKRSGRKAQRTAMAALKHTHEKRGDRWVQKDEAGPSDPRSRKTTAQKRRGEGETFGGVDVEQNTKQELYERARRFGVEGRSKMSKRELARALARKR